MKNIEELRESAAERIFLVPVSEDGDLCYCWCDEPAPSEGMIASEAVEYVRADIVQTLRGQLEESERRGNELAAHVERVDRFIKSDLSDPEDERPRHLISSINRLREIASDVPYASLAAHDARLLRGLAEELDNHSLLDRGCLLIRAARLERGES